MMMNFTRLNVSSKTLVEEFFKVEQFDYNLQYQSEKIASNPTYPGLTNWLIAIWSLLI